MPDALLVTSSFLPGRGGIESYLAELCDLVAPRLAVLAAPERDGAPLPRDLSYETIPGPARMLWPGTAILEKTVAECDRLGTDRVVFGTPWPLVLLGPRLAERGIRYSVIVHGAELLVPAAVPLLRRKVARALEASELLLPVSDFTSRHVSRLLESTGHRVPPIRVLRARVDLERFSPEVDTSAVSERHGLGGRPVILCFGRLVPRKGVDRLIRMMPDIARRVPEAVLFVAGTGPEERKLQRLAASVDADVVFGGRIPDKDAPAVYARADVFALAVADRWFGLEIEGLGVVLLEAAASGVPCVTGRSGGTPEAVVDGVTGYVADPETPLFAERVVNLLTDDARRRGMGEAGRAHVARNFSVAAATEPLNEWLNGPSGGRG